MQQAIDNHFRNTSSAAKELKILETDKQFTGTRFQLFAYCFSNLLVYTPPSALYRLFCPQNDFISGNTQF
jgi:hypothetical protein